jgi:uncharacterized C2H2 Zn-finger protein
MIGNLITYRSPKTELTVADIFREYWPQYRQKYPVTSQQAKVVGSIMACRTAQLGGRIDQCSECGALVFRFNSCRDRHCNQCQKYEKAKWVQKQKVLQLPISYFHVIFTTDHALNPLIEANPNQFYDLLFATVNGVLQEQAQTELGCQLGFTAVLHTWGQKMDKHVHLHCVVTGGGLASDGSRWVPSRSRRYLMDVVKLSAAYREALLAEVERKWRRGEWELPGQAKEIDWGQVIEELRAKKWEVYCKPFEQPETVYEYLSQYVHQVAISNYRLVSLEAGVVSFLYYDNRERSQSGEKGPQKVMKLPVLEFMRRFVSHILPKGYRRIRYFGLHHSSARAEKLPRCRRLLGLAGELPEVEPLSLMAWLKELLGEEVDRCPHCGASGSLFQRSEFEQLGWLAALILSLFGQPTRQGVCR